MGYKNVDLENTRLKKSTKGNANSTEHVFSILQASTDSDDTPVFFGQLETGYKEVFLERGDHAKELKRVNNALLAAVRYCANNEQKQMLENLVAYFATGDVEAYKKSLSNWVADKGPHILP